MAIVFSRLQLHLLPLLVLPNLQLARGRFLHRLILLMFLLWPAVAAEECQMDQHHQAAVAAVAELFLQLEFQ
jgi:hypothetical protein